MQTALKVGVLYDCRVKFPHGSDIQRIASLLKDPSKIDIQTGSEAGSIIPLVKDPNSNRQFIMTDARRLFAEDPSFVKEIFKMSFDDIMNDGLEREEPSDFPALVVLCTPEHDGSLRDYGNFLLYDFIETDVV